MAPGSPAPLVGIIMGTKSDWESMAQAAQILDGLAIPHEVLVMSAHRTPELLEEYVTAAEDRGLEVIIAGSRRSGASGRGGRPRGTLLPVLGVPIQSKALYGMDSLLSIVQMPRGSPWARWRSGRRAPPTRGCSPPPCSANKHPHIRAALRKYRDAQTQALAGQTDPRT